MSPDRDGYGSPMLRLVLVTIGDPTQLTGGHLYQRRLAQHASEAGATIDVRPIPSRPLTAQRLAAGAILRDAASHADMLIVDSIAAASVAGRMEHLGVPTLGLVHQRPGGAAPTRRRYALDLRAYREMTAVVATGPALANELRALGVENVEVLIPGTDPAPEIADPPDLRDGRRIAILCVANWLPAKNVAELLIAFKSLPPSAATLHLVGDTRANRPYGDKVFGLLRDPSLSHRVVVHGALEPDAVAPLRAGADLFALPSLEETYGMAWAEAMAAGLPIVGWNTSNLPNLITHGSEGLLVSTGDTRGLTSALATLAIDTSLRIRLGRAAKQRAAAFPTWEETTRRFVGIARDTAGQPAPR